MQLKEPQTPPVLFFLFIFILFFAPLAFATAELWSLTIVELSVGLLGLMFIWHQFKGRLTAVEIPGILPLLLLLGWMLFQLVPLPPEIIALLSPGAYDAYQPVHQAAGTSGWMPLTVNQKATLLETLRIGSYALFYILTVQLLAGSKNLHKTVKIVAGLVIFIAFLAIIQRYTSPDQIYWFRSGPDARYMGPWVNRSQFAGFMAMLLPVILGIFLYFRPVIDENETLRAKVVDFFSATTSNYQMLLAFGIVVILFSILLSLGRAGIIITFLSLVLFYFLLSRKKNRRSWPVVLLFIGGFVLFILNFGAEELLSRVNDTFTPEGELKFDRFRTWSDTLQIIKFFWLTGAGFGTFVDVFPVFKTIPNALIYDHAHNDYLELITDGGIIGLTLAGWFVLAILVHGWDMIQRRRDNFSVLVGIGAFVGICSMLFYALSDFNMHNGADGLYFFFLCGLLVSCGNTRTHYRTSTTLLEPLAKRKKVAVLTLSVILLGGVLLFPARIFLGQWMYADSVEGVYLSRQLAEEKLAELSETVRGIGAYDPLEGAYPAVLGDIFKYLGSREMALHYYLLAGQRQPLRGEFLQKAAVMLPPARSQTADLLMELSYRRSLKKEAMILTFAEWLLWRGNDARAAQVLHKGLAANDKLFEEALLLIDANFDHEEVARILPEKVGVWIKYGKFLEELGDMEGSEFFRGRALDFVDSEETVSSSWYWDVYSFFTRVKKEEKALEVLRQAVVRFPEDVGFHIRLGDYYKKQGIYYRARQEYEQALLFDPDNEGVRRKLEQLESR